MKKHASSYQKKLFGATLATMVAAGTLTTAVPVHTHAEEVGIPSFSDVKNIESHHFYDSVRSLASRGIVKGFGDGTFKPYQSVTRGQMASVLAKTLGMNIENVKNPGFKDVKVTDEYYGPIAALVNAGIIDGYSDKTFKPGEPLTRAQMSKIISNGFKLEEEKLTNTPFTDVKAGDWYADYVQVLIANKITTGTTSTTFAPNAHVTRGQMASFIVRGESPVQRTAITGFYNTNPEKLAVSQIARYDSGQGETGTEILAYDANLKKAFVTNGAVKGFDIVSFENLKSGTLTGITETTRVLLSDFNIDGVADITSIASHPTKDLIAISAVSNPKTERGYIIFATKDGKFLKSVQVGALPDMVTFTPDGTKAIVANEGEPDDNAEKTSDLIDPAGSISIIDVATYVHTELQFTEAIVDDKVRMSYQGKGKSYLAQLEPEYVTVSADSKTAYVSLQENNAIATVDLEKGEIQHIKGLGVKDFSKPGNELDALKDGAVKLEKQPILSFYMPDAIETFTVGTGDTTQTYIITPNEGDARDYEGFSEDKKIEKIIEDVKLNADNYAGYTQAELDAFDLTTLIDYKITTEDGKNADGEYEALYGYGGRSFSIFNAETMELAFDSGSDFESIIANDPRLKQYFSVSNDNVDVDDRSNSKGPEPESVVTGEMNGKTYGFIALERISGIMVYDLTNPSSPEFVTFITSRDFSEDVAGDVAPEGLRFISAAESPTGKALLAATHEMSGTVAVYEFE